MQRRDFVKTTGIVATGGLSTFAGCSGSGGGSKTTTKQAGDDGSKSNTVLMVSGGGEFYFDPIGLFVENGETVTFKIKSGSHSATAYKEGNGYASVTRIPDGAGSFNSGTLTEEGATFQHTFETTGTYDYFCIPHKSYGMVGRIVVGEPGGPAEGSMPPDGKVPKSDKIVSQGAVSYDDFTG